MAVLVSWGIRARTPKFGKKTRSELKLRGKPDSLLSDAVCVALVRCAGGLSGQQDTIVERIAAVLPNLKMNPRKGTRKMSHNKIEAWLHAAGRSVALGGSSVRSLAHQLASLADAVPSDPELRYPWIWAMASALFLNQDMADWLVEGDLVEPVTSALLDCGTALREEGGARSELGLALLGMCRVRNGRQDAYGPASAWAARVLGAIDGWQDDIRENAKMRFKIGSGRLLWPALKETLDGTRVALVEVAR